MTTPAETVVAFLKQWEEPGGFHASLRAYFTPDTVWENVGLSKTIGLEEALAAFSSLSAVGMLVEIGTVAEVGNKVLIEREDTMLNPDGSVLGTFMVMGIFEITDGKITAMRDYFDTKGMSELM